MGREGGLAAVGLESVWKRLYKTVQICMEILSSCLQVSHVVWLSPEKISLRPWQDLCRLLSSCFTLVESDLGRRARSLLPPSSRPSSKPASSFSIFVYQEVLLEGYG